jgi:hypothetical protein
MAKLAHCKNVDKKCKNGGKVICKHKIGKREKMLDFISDEKRMLILNG